MPKYKLLLFGRTISIEFKNGGINDSGYGEKI
jgi:hypothetical protein